MMSLTNAKLNLSVICFALNDNWKRLKQQTTEMQKNWIVSFILGVIFAVTDWKLADESNWYFNV